MAALQEQLGLNSTNSSKPPSSDLPGTRPPLSQQDKNRRKRRRKKGRGGHQRKLLPPEKVTSFIDLSPSTCKDCGLHLDGPELPPIIHQVIDLPDIEPDVTQYNLHARTCPCCQTTTRATPPEIHHCFIGPNLEAAIAYATGYLNLSRDNARQMFGDLMGIHIAKGSISKSEARTTDALEAVCRQAREHVQNAKIINADETGWRHQNKYRVMWVALSYAVAYFQIAAERSKAVCQELLSTRERNPDTCAVGCDRYGAYAWLGEKRQACWSHLDRDFERIAHSKDPRAAKIGDELLKCADKVFDGVWKYKQGDLSFEELGVEAEEIRKVVRKLGEQAVKQQLGGKCGAVCKWLVEHEATLWTYARIKGVEPTNNAAERALRRAVMWRKSSQGTRSERGDRFAERMLTCVTTLKLQARHVLSFLKEAIVAHRNGIASPSLLPSST